MTDFEKDEPLIWLQWVQRQALERVPIRPASRGELLTSAILLVIGLLAVLGALLFVSTDADTEPSWVPRVFAFGAVVGVGSLAMVTRATYKRRQFLANALRVAMSFEAHGFKDEEARKQSGVDSVDIGLIAEALGLRDALLASGDVREAERLNTALPPPIRRA